MSFSPILLLHIGSGTLGLLSGGAAVFLRKGSRRHGIAGDIFVISMVVLGASGAYLGFMKHQTINAAMGSLTCYLVITAWLTARRRNEGTSIFDWGALMIPLVVAAAFIINGLAALNSQTGSKDGVPAAMYFIIGSVALLMAIGDVRMLMRGGVSGTRRLVRHLWRMCFALFIASGSLFLARPHLFPALLRTTGIIVLLGFLPLMLMIFWLVRVRFANGYKRKPAQMMGSAQIVLQR